MASRCWVLGLGELLLWGDDCVGVVLVDER